jgi:hypothetical protein
MPFRKPGTYEPAPKIELQVWDHRYFKLLTPFAYHPHGWCRDAEITVPAHSTSGGKEVTDLASVPAALWGLLPSYGRQLRAALLHDHLCEQVNEILEKGNSRAAYPARRIADQLFWQAMRDRGDTEGDLRKRMPWFRARIFWAGVGWARYCKLRRLRAVLMTLQILLGSAALYFAAGVLPRTWIASLTGSEWSGNPAVYLLVYATALALCVAWWRDAGIPLVGLLVMPILMPVLAVTLAAQLLLAVPDTVIKLASRRRQPRPIVGPAFRKLRLPHPDTSPPAPGPLKPAA